MKKWWEVIMDDRLQKQMEFALEIDKVKNVFRQTHLSGNGRNENEIGEIVGKAMTILQNTNSVYPTNEIEWLMAWCWNKGNKWRYLHEKEKASEWYGKAVFFVAKLEKKEELKEKLMKEFSAFQAE